MSDKRYHVVPTSLDVADGVESISRSTLKLSPNERNWLVFGIAINAVVIPSFRNDVNVKMKTFFNELNLKLATGTTKLWNGTKPMSKTLAMWNVLVLRLNKWSHSGDTVPQWIHLYLPSCRPGFEYQAHFIQIELWHVEKTKINRKIGWDASSYPVDGTNDHGKERK